MGRVTLIAFSIATIFFIGLASTLVYGQNNSVFFDDNFVHAEWNVPPGPSPGLLSPFNFVTFSSSGLPLSPIPPEPSMLCSDISCRFRVPNFIDNLDTKIIEIHITFVELPNNLESHTPTIPSTVTCFDPTVPGGSSPGSVINGFLGPTPDQWTWQIECRPNPDWEEIIIEREPFVDMQSVEIWTTSFDDIAVGGTLIPIDTTALLLAGVQSISMWMIPVVAAGVVIGIFVIKRRK